MTIALVGTPPIALLLAFSLWEMSRRLGLPRWADYVPPEGEDEPDW